MLRNHLTSPTIASQGSILIPYTKVLTYPTPIIYYRFSSVNVTVHAHANHIIRSVAEIVSPYLPTSNISGNRVFYNNNEPYLDWLLFILGQHSIPQTLT